MTGDVQRSIHDLVDYLKSTHREGDLYRGQNRDYPVMVPSFYRPFVKDLTQSVHIAEIDRERFNQLYASDKRARLRYDTMQRLIGDFDLGIGLGNIIAQQYGLSSEALDVTHDIDVAAYFATRKYPDYSHISEGVGVIYRFRDLDSDGLPADFTLAALANHFEMGRAEAGYYDFFVHEKEMDQVFERERWWGYQPGTISEVWTLRAIGSWASLRKALSATEVLKLRAFLDRALDDKVFRWEKTRFQRQSGGMIRPRICWQASSPSTWRVAHDADEARMLRMGRRIPHEMPMPVDSSGKWPLVLPSCAIKRRLVGVENIRANAACQVHEFKHSPLRITGFYRRELWPEPAEDPLFGALWNVALGRMIPEYSESTMPSVDDAAEGILDRGYRVVGEKKTRDGRDDEELMHCQLVDAVENRSFGPPRALDCEREIRPRIQNGDYAGAMRAALTGLRLEPRNSDLLIGLAECLKRRLKPRWARKVVDAALRHEPDNPWLLYMKAWDSAYERDYEAALPLIDRALATYDESPRDFSIYYLLHLRAVLAGLGYGNVRLTSFVAMLRKNGFDHSDVMKTIEEWVSDGE